MPKVLNFMFRLLSGTHSVFCDTGFADVTSIRPADVNSQYDFPRVGEIRVLQLETGELFEMDCGSARFI